MSKQFSDRQCKLSLLLEKFGTQDMRLDYPSMTIDEKYALYNRLSRYESER